jgi:hypothetical protein
MSEVFTECTRVRNSRAPLTQPYTARSTALAGWLAHPDRPLHVCASGVAHGVQCVGGGGRHQGLVVHAGGPGGLQCGVGGVRRQGRHTAGGAWVGGRLSACVRVRVRGWRRCQVRMMRDLAPPHHEQVQVLVSELWKHLSKAQAEGSLAPATVTHADRQQQVRWGGVFGGNGRGTRERAMLLGVVRGKDRPLKEAMLVSLTGRRWRVRWSGWCRRWWGWGASCSPRSICPRSAHPPGVHGTVELASPYACCIGRRPFAPCVRAYS